MSYELHITRRDHWSDDIGDSISADEWLALIDADSELAIDRRNGPHFAVMAGQGEGERHWLNWFEGDIRTNCIDQAMLAKMLQIAHALGATVQGDDGEHYSHVADIPEETPVRPGAAHEASRVPRFERREILWRVVIYGTIVIAIVALNVLGIP